MDGDSDSIASIHSKYNNSDHYTTQEEESSIADSDNELSDLTPSKPEGGIDHSPDQATIQLEFDSNPASENEFSDTFSPKDSSSDDPSIPIQHDKSIEPSSRRLAQYAAAGDSTTDESDSYLSSDSSSDSSSSSASSSSDHSTLAASQDSAKDNPKSNVQSKSDKSDFIDKINSSIPVLPPSPTAVNHHQDTSHVTSANSSPHSLGLPLYTVDLTEHVDSPSESDDHVHDEVTDTSQPGIYLSTAHFPSLVDMKRSRHRDGIAVDPNPPVKRLKPFIIKHLYVTINNATLNPVIPRSCKQSYSVPECSEWVTAIQPELNSHNKEFNTLHSIIVTDREIKDQYKSKTVAPQWVFNANTDGTTKLD